MVYYNFIIRWLDFKFAFVLAENTFVNFFMADINPIAKLERL